MGNRRRSHAGSAHPPRRLRVGCLNVCGCNQDVKKGEIGSMFEERNLDVLALSETKLKGKGEEWFGNVWGVKSGVSERTRAREGVAILLKQELWEYVIECKKVNSRLIWVKLKVDGERWVIIGAYAPGHEKKDQERQVFWEQLNECVSGFDARDRVIMMGDLNAKVSNVAVEGIIGIHGVFSVVNGNGEELVDLCAEKGLMIGNTWFKKQDIHKYTYVSRRDGQRALLDYMLIDRRAKERLLDVNVLRGATGGMSDHYLVEAMVKICMGFQKRRVNVGVKRVVRVSELEKETCVRKYQERLSTEWKKVRTMEVRGVGEEWDVFRESVMDCAKDACGMRRVGGGLIRKGSEWWDEEVRVLVKEKREAFGRFLQGKNAIEWEFKKERDRRSRERCKR
ncbi:craniofacial development protein 2-like [Panulirus ornatus]|uniref:craniofacial development protein 2-like n=1 Tax=Panulirus ornatus TaxID=150431 RepID=UPI003A89C8F8